MQRSMKNQNSDNLHIGYEIIKGLEQSASGLKFVAILCRQLTFSL